MTALIIQRENAGGKLILADPHAIGARAFKDCAELTQIRIPANCAIGDGAFSGCGTVYIYAPAGSPAQTFCNNPANANCIFCAE